MSGGGDDSIFGEGGGGTDAGGRGTRGRSNFIDDDFSRDVSEKGVRGDKIGAWEGRSRVNPTLSNVAETPCKSERRRFTVFFISGEGP